MLRKTVAVLSVAALAGAGAASVLPEAMAKDLGQQGQIQLAAGCNPCNPCGAAKACNPCNPCGAKKACNPCNPCNPCGAKKACNPCNPCNPCKAD